MFMSEKNVIYRADRLCRWIQFNFIIALCLLVSLKGIILTKCEKTDTGKASISLNCSSDQMIHVISELCGRRTSEDNCTVVKADSNTKLSSSDGNGLVVNCNGNTTCVEETAIAPLCNGSGFAFELKYECVEGSKNICSPINQTGPLSSLYLHSPGFPKTTGEEVCECSVSGEYLEVMVVQHGGLQGVLQINVSGENFTTWTGKGVVFVNRMIQPKLNATNVLLRYSSKQQMDSSSWIQIQGNITAATCRMKSLQTQKRRKATTKTTTMKSTNKTKTTTSPLESPKTSQETTSSTTAPEMTSTSTTDEPSTKRTTGKAFTTTTSQKSTTMEHQLLTTISPTTMSQHEESTTNGMTNSYETTTKTPKTETEFIILSGGISGGVVVFIIFITITCYLCRKRNVSNGTVDKTKDVHTGYDVIDEMKTFSLPHNANPKFCTTMNLRSSGFGQTIPSRDNYHHITHTTVQTTDDIINELKTFSLPRNANPNLCTTIPRSSGFGQTDPSLDNYHHITLTSVQRKEDRRLSDTPYDKINAKFNGNNPRLVPQSPANQMKGDANIHYNHLNNGFGPIDEDRGNGVQVHQLHSVVCDDNEEVASSNIYHTLEAVTNDEDKDDILVDNDLYHTYRASGYMETHTHGYRSPDDESIMVDNDLYYSDDTN